MALSISISSSAISCSSITPTPTASSLSSSKSFFFTSASVPSFNLQISNTPKRSSSSSSSSKKRFSCNALFGLGMPELVVIAGVVALVFGPKKLPEVGRSIGKTVKSFQQAAKEFETELKKDPEPVGNPPGEVVKEVGKEEEQGVEVSSVKES